MAHGHGHGAGHEEHGLLEGRNKIIALVIAVMALFLAFAETLGKSAQTAGISHNVEASNLWAFFQAKTIRQTAVQVGTEILKIDLVRADGEASAAAAKAALAKRIDSWEQISKRYDSELMQPPVRKEVNLNPPYGEGRRELLARAIAAEAKRDTALARYHHYEVASAGFQIAIVLASATVITGMIVLTYLACGLGVVGLIFMAIGLFAPHSVHLF